MTAGYSCSYNVRGLPKMYFEILKSAKTKKYWFVIRSLGNHQALASSEMYTRKANAINAVQVIANSKNAHYIDRTQE